MKQIKTINDLNDVLKQDDNLQVIKFYGTWCGPCRMLQHIIESIEPTYESVNFYEVDIDDCEETLIEKYGVMNVPTTIFFKDGCELDKHIGFMPESVLKNKINENLGK